MPPHSKVLVQLFYGSVLSISEIFVVVEPAKLGWHRSTLDLNKEPAGNSITFATNRCMAHQKVVGFGVFFGKTDGLSKRFQRLGRKSKRLQDKAD